MLLSYLFEAAGVLLTRVPKWSTVKAWGEGGAIAWRDRPAARLGVREPNDFDEAFAAMTRDTPDAILMVADSLTILNRKRVYDFATAHRLPAVYEVDFLVADGGLMPYGPDLAE